MSGVGTGADDIVARFAQQATPGHQMQPLVAVQIIITALHGNIRGPRRCNTRDPRVRVRASVYEGGRWGTRIHGFRVAIACKSTLARERASKRANATGSVHFRRI